MSGDDYPGSVNWDVVYKKFHDQVDISQKINKELEGHRGTNIYPGFSDIAVALSQSRPLTCID